MTDQDKRFLDDCRHQHDALVKTGCVRNVNVEAMIEVMRANFEKVVIVDRNSYDDVTAFIKRLYMKYDRYLTGEAVLLIPDKRGQVEITVV